MVPVEAMASGRPVAFGRGSATETVTKGRFRSSFRDQSVETISSAVEDLANIENRA
jgi:hypothetical protein